MTCEWYDTIISIAVKRYTNAILYFKIPRSANREKTAYRISAWFRDKSHLRMSQKKL
jgi:hypothetical protein